MSPPEIVLLVLVLVAIGIIVITSRVAYGCGYRQGASDTTRQLSAFQRLKTIERSGYEHGRN